MENQKYERYIRKTFKSKARIEKLQNIWNNTYPKGCGLTLVSKEQVFKEKAEQEGFTDKEVKAFMEL